MKYGLIGINGLYNFGCEAIVRGTYRFLKDRDPKCTVIYYSKNYDSDKDVLRDIDVQVKKIEVHRSFYKRVNNKICSLLKSGHVQLYFDANAIINEVDAIVSIGGDIFTIPKVKREKGKYSFANEYLEFSRHTIKAGKPVYLYGASVGPFGDYKRAVEYYTKVLKMFRKIICREEDTMAYLSQLGINNTCFSPDPAFLVERSGKGEKTKRYIGINLSPLSLRELYGSFNEDKIQKMSRILEDIYRKNGIDILLIPHVISPDLTDDDATFLQKVKKGISAEITDHFHLADYSKGFLGIKEQLLECYIIVSARMHCAINAIHEAVPTIFLSYSSKSIGMAQYIYGNKKWVIGLQKLESDLMTHIDALLLESDSLSEYLKLRNEEIKRFYFEQKHELDELFRIRGN